jgi:hypothetical protein
MVRSLLSILVLTILGIVWPCAADAQEASAGAVLVRVWGEDEPDSRGGEVPAPEVSEPGQVVVGSGFLVSPSGYLLTDARLLSGDVTAIEVVVPSLMGDDGGGRYEATLVASDPLLGVALLAIYPEREPDYLRVGDSETLVRGERVSVSGWLDDGRSRTSALRFTATRQDEYGVTQLLDLDGRLAAGFAGAAVVDREGLVVAVARPGDDGTTALGVPINAVKEFLHVHGPAGEFPRSLELGPMQELDEKGLRLRLVDGISDSWPGRTRFESYPDPNGVSLRIERLASPQQLGYLESRLLAGDFGGLPAVRIGDRTNDERSIRRSQPRLIGSAVAEWNGSTFAVEYLVMRLGEERILARYELPEEMAAYNRSVVRRSLESLQVTRLLMLPVSKPLAVTLEAVRSPPTGMQALTVPEGWRLETVVAVLPGDLPEPDHILAVSPGQDYTVRFTAYFWPAGSAAEAAARPAIHGGDLAVEVDGVEYWLGRAGVSVVEGTLLLECRAPTAKVEFVQEACAEWQAAAGAEDRY